MGGATIDLYLEPGAPEGRATDDVDCVVELGSKAKYHDLEAELRKLGFEHPMGERAPLCRWKYSNIQVDVMPTEGAVLGFTNRWYREALEHAERFTLPDGESIEAFSAPYLLASKLEAFRDRGRSDYLASRDMNDVIALLDGCADIEAKVAAAPAGVRAYLAQEFRKLRDSEQFLEAVTGNLMRPQTVQRCLALVRRLAALS